MRESYSMFRKIFLASIIATMNIWLVSAFEASYYSDAFEGSTSSNGTTFSQANHTAAICYEELSQLAYVSTAQTGMVVTLTDRPNCSRHTDRIDLSSSVFSTFAPLSSWLITDISATPLGIKTGKFVKRNLSQEEFLDYSVELSSPIANTFFAWETIKIQGKILNSKKQVAVFFKDKSSSEKYTYSYLVGSNNSFDLVVPLPKNTWEYFFKILSISPWEELTINNLASILVVDRSIKDLYPEISPSRLRYLPINQSSIITDKAVTVDFRKNIWWQFSITQGSKIFTTDWQVLSLSWINLSSGQASYVFTGYTLSTPSSLDISPLPIYSSSWVVYIDRVRRSTGDGVATMRKVWKTVQFSFRVREWYVTKPNYYVTLPNGDVREYSINKKFINSNWYLKTNVLISWAFPITDKWTYRFEVNKSSWIAYINVPFYTDLTFPVIEESLVLTNWESYESRILASLNKMRKTLGRSDLSIDPELSRIAELKARDMYITTGGSGLWVTHSNSKWGDIRVFAEFYWVKRNSFWENVAGSNNTGKTAILELHDGLEESPAHRNNMISPNFSKVWIGYYQKGGYSYLVHAFSN